MLENLTRKQKTVVIVIVVLIILLVLYFAVIRPFIRSSRVKQINVEQNTGPLNEGPISPISGVACENWNKRPIAVMQASDVPARPIAGLSQADMVIEMPVITSSITRLMGVYICNIPPEVGSMRSARHDFVHLAKGLDAVFAHWGRSELDWFINQLNGGVIENINCNGDAGKSGGECCFRKEGFARGVDTGYMKGDKLAECVSNFGYGRDSSFSGYPHQAEISSDQRPNGGKLRVAFGGAYAAEYLYDRETNSYKRIWGNVIDTDRSTGEEILTKNIAVLFARSEQIEGQYNNVQLGDPWLDESDSGDAFYYFNGQELRGTWKKDKSSAASKLFFYDESGREVQFVPGQIWVEILEPGQRLRWEPV